MGALFSRKKQKSYKDTLEDLEKDIKKLSERRQRNVYQEKSFIGYLLILSFVTYLIGALIFYIYFSPYSWLEYGIYSIPLILFPVLVYLLKKLLNMYFAHKKAQLNLQLSTLQSEKRRVLNEVMEKETFNVARDLLQRFDPQHPSLQATREGRGRGARDQQQTPQHRGGELRQRRTTHTPHPSQQHQQQQRQQQQRVAQTVPRPSRPSHPPTVSPPTITSTQAPAPPHSATATAAQSQPPQAPAQPAPSQPPSQPPSLPPHHSNNFIPPGMCLGLAPGPPTPSPILPRERSSLDKMVEYLVGDGPNNRYALVCSSCHSHNGMALRDEFEYISFRCAYCYHLNPARKTKPALRPPSPLPSPTADVGAGLGASATNQVEPSERRSRDSNASQSGMEAHSTATPPPMEEVEGQAPQPPVRDQRSRSADVTPPTD